MNYLNVFLLLQEKQRKATVALYHIETKLATLNALGNNTAIKAISQLKLNFYKQETRRDSPLI